MVIRKPVSIPNSSTKTTLAKKRTEQNLTEQSRTEPNTEHRPRKHTDTQTPCDTQGRQKRARNTTVSEHAKHTLNTHFTLDPCDLTGKLLHVNALGEGARKHAPVYPARPQIVWELFF